MTTAEPSSGKFKKGRSGNPGGRPKTDHSIRDLARQHCPKAIATLAEIMCGKRVTAVARVKAAIAILDRGYGRPPQAMEITGGVRMEGDLGGDIEEARILAFTAECIAKEIERQKPSLKPVDRLDVARRVVEQFIKEQPENAQTPDT